jgi:mRNA-degrading endonuclease toxin of MazEF toxin-antitoxin module
LQRPRKIRQGEIYWIENFPPLDGQVAKNRPVLVIGSVDPKNPKAPVLVVGISHTASTPEKDPDMERLPDTQQSPSAKTGMTRPSWALPRWVLPVNRERFGDPCGYVKGELLRRIVKAVADRWEKSGGADCWHGTGG